MDIALIIEKIILISVILGVSLGIAMYTTLAERKFAGFFQDRVGPNRAGPWGILQLSPQRFRSNVQRPRNCA